MAAPSRTRTERDAPLGLGVICLSHSWGGLEQVAAFDAMEAAACGVSVKVLCLEGTPVQRKLEGQPGIQLLPAFFRPKNHFDFQIRSVLQRWLAEGTRVFHIHQPSLLPSVAPWLAFSSSAALVVSRHIMSGHDKRDPFHWALYRRVDSLVVMSEALRSNVLATHAIAHSKVEVVPLGVDCERFDPMRVDGRKLREAWGADPDSFVVGVVGRLDPAKGQDIFLESAARLLQGRSDLEKRRLRFVIVGEETLGSHSNYQSWLQERARQLGVDRQVVFTGFCENVPEVMRALDLFVMPSAQEAFGLVAIEAMAMERPVVISQGGSASEIVGQEKFGKFAVPGDAASLECQIRFFIERPELCQSMGKSARQHIIDRFERSLRRRKMIELYQRVLDRRSPKSS